MPRSAPTACRSIWPRWPGASPASATRDPRPATRDPQAGAPVPRCPGAGAPFLVTLGGEHLLTYGVVSGLVADPAELTIVQIDAHADLADELDGRRWSHGTVMRRLWERGCRLVQIGVRSLSRAEHELIEGRGTRYSGSRIETFFAHDLARRWPELLHLLACLEGPVYLSLDVDGLDPSIVPSTGTPQPNGLSWPQAMELIRAISAAPCDWIGADVVEFIASPHPPGCDLTVARLVMKILAWWASSHV